MLKCLENGCFLSFAETIQLLQHASQCTSNICTVTFIQGNDVSHHLHRWPHEILANKKMYVESLRAKKKKKIKCVYKNEENIMSLHHFAAELFQKANTCSLELR